MAKTVQAKTPLKTDELGINNILNSKVDVPAGQQLTYFPITGAVASSATTNQGPLLVLDSSPDTYWQPSDQVAGAHIELTTPNPYTCYGADIKFKESEGKKFNLKIDVLDKENNRWLTMVTAESSLIDDNKYERFQAAQHFKSNTYRVIINSVFDTATNHLYTQPKITQVRLFGLVPEEDIKKYRENITKDTVCPEGYGKDAESGQCVKSIPSQIIKPKTVDAKSAIDMGTTEPAGNDPENLLSVDPNDKLTLKGVGSTIEYSLSRTDAIYGVYIHKLNNPPRQYTTLVAFYNGQDKQPFYSFVVDIPDTQDKYVHLLNQPLRADRFVLSVVDNTEPNQWFSLFGLYLIGEQNVGPEITEPPIPKSCSIKKGGWGSVSDKNPEEWTVKEMADADKKGKWKGIGKDNKNVFHLCDSKEDAEAFIKRKIWESKQKPPTEPPVEPPVEPPTEPPVEPPVEPPTEPPVDPNGRKIKNVVYPEPKSKDKNTKSIPFDAEIAKKNYAKEHTLPLPLLSKTDKYGEKYTNIPALLTQLGYPELAKTKDYIYAHEKTDPYENNNSGGESKRMDMKGVDYPNNEYQLKLNNKSDDMGDETSKKEFGTHTNGIKANEADCFIIQLANDGKSAVTQLEPGHMLSDPHGYGDKFNKVSLKGLPAFAGNTYSVRFIRIVDLDNRRVIGLVAVKFHTGDGPKEWTLKYETVVYDGMGGGRGLKDPFRAWAVHAGISNTVGSTIRMDSQPKKAMKKGDDYDNARITQIIDYEPVVAAAPPKK